MDFVEPQGLTSIKGLGYRLANTPKTPLKSPTIPQKRP